MPKKTEFKSENGSSPKEVGFMDNAKKIMPRWALCVALAGVMAPSSKAQAAEQTAQVETVIGQNLKCFAMGGKTADQAAQELFVSKFKVSPEAANVRLVIVSGPTGPLGSVEFLVERRAAEKKIETGYRVSSFSPESGYARGFAVFETEEPAKAREYALLVVSSGLVQRNWAISKADLERDFDLKIEMMFGAKPPKQIYKVTWSMKEAPKPKNEEAKRLITAEERQLWLKKDQAMVAELKKTFEEYRLKYGNRPAFSSFENGVKEKISKLEKEILELKSNNPLWGYYELNGSPEFLGEAVAGVIIDENAKNLLTADEKRERARSKMQRNVAKLGVPRVYPQNDVGQAATIDMPSTAGGGQVNIGKKKVDAIVPPAQTNEENLIEIGTDAQNSAMRSKLQKIVKTCYDNVLKRNPTLKGKLVLSFMVKKDGSVGLINFKRGNDVLKNDDLEQSIANRIGRLRFARQNEDTPVEFPILLTGGSEF